LLVVVLLPKQKGNMMNNQVIWNNLNKTSKMGFVFTIIMTLMTAVGAFLNLAQVQLPLAINLPWYIATILGFAKALAVIAFISNRFPTLREWAYAGLFFELIAGAACHILSGAPLRHAMPALFDLSVVAISYFYWHKKNYQIRYLNDLEVINTKI
jgi:hypothetical protein